MSADRPTGSRTGLPGSRAGLPGSRTGLPASPRCPFCDRTETRLVNSFGSQLSVATYWCDRCRTAFEHVKWAGANPAAP